MFEENIGKYFKSDNIFQYNTFNKIVNNNSNELTEYKISDKSKNNTKIHNNDIEKNCKDQEHYKKEYYNKIIQLYGF